MDQNRQIRLLIAPFFFFASLATALFFKDLDGSLEWLKGISYGPITAMVALTAIAALPIGFLINTLTTFSLRLIFALFKWRKYDLDITKNDFDGILKYFDNSLKNHIIDEAKITDNKWCDKRRPANLIRYVTVIFDHGIVKKKWPGVHEWGARTYSIYMVSANSAFSIIASIIITLCCQLHTHCFWYIINFVFLVILIFGAYWGRHETLGLTRLLIHGEYKNEDGQS